MPAKKRRRRRKKRYHTGVYVSVKSGQHYKYRSGWELAYMQYLDAWTDVVSWTYENLAIPYVSNVRTGKLRKYYPDFYVQFVDGSARLVEIKPRRKVTHVTVQKKLRAAEGWCREHGMALEVMTEIELKALGLLK